MCGRYLIDGDDYLDILTEVGHGAVPFLTASGVAASSEVQGGTMASPLSFEVFPTNVAPVITGGGALAIKWGFPHWKNSGVIINARAETALEKNMFRKPLLERRCLVPSSGFFEWAHVSGRKKKDKYLLRLPGENILYMAGMTGVFRETSGEEYSAFVILTTGASDSVASIHDRMPVILAPDERDAWIGDAGFMEYALQRPGPELVLLPA